jgi:hypothetical protein
VQGEILRVVWNWLICGLVVQGSSPWIDSGCFVDNFTG